ncbi:DUF1684 domain-containing protein [Jannaschia sp. R86511]|uniref:DUF1684 domain-containing protein n=1 Tax=Jannaschia sp. R86511 TaxID=3093853 RepID=UPI0036D23707
MAEGTDGTTAGEAGGLTTPSTRLEVLDWRRRVREAYDAVRTETHVTVAHSMWSRRRDELFATHPASPLSPEARRVFRGLPVAPYDPAFRFEVEVQPTAPHRMEVPTGTDGVVPFDRIGVVDLPGVGTLDVWWLAAYGGGVFLPVRDGLAGRDGGTFGGGRYVLDTVKGADLGGSDGGSRLVVDLNFAYNPSCAYDAAWACPLAGPGNTVDVELRVGELMALPG